ncbi:MAG: porin [Pseudomonadota bacterium]
MKKALMSSSAIVLAAAVAAPANAAEVELGLGGFVESWIGYGSTDIDGAAATFDVDGVDAKFDGEVFFLPSITLDNGIKIGANVQLEFRADAGGRGTSDVIDEAYVFVKGSFGELLVGDENSAGYKMTYAAPDVSFIGINSPSTTIFVNYSGSQGGVTVGSNIFRGTLGATFIENAGNNDAGRITYFTPRFAGFQLGASYARDVNRDTISQQDLDGDGVLSDVVDIGANYVNSFGGFDVAVSGRWGIASLSGSSASAATPTVSVDGGGVVTNDATGGAAPAGNTVLLQGSPASAATAGSNPQIWGAGINLGFAGFSIGGSFAEQNDAGNADGRSFDVGVSYRTGPWGFSVTYFNGENVDNENAGAGADENLQQIQLAVDYDLAKGVDLNIAGGYVDLDEDLSDDGTIGGNDVEGYWGGVGMRLRF